VTIGNLLIIWAIGAVVVLIASCMAVESEPTTHGQGILMRMGCAVAVFWPLFLAYVVVASPWLAYTYHSTRGERR